MLGNTTSRGEGAAVEIADLAPHDFAHLPGHALELRRSDLEHLKKSKAFTA